MNDHDEIPVGPVKDQQDLNEENKDGYIETPVNPDGFFNEINNKGACSVRVALRVRPLIAHEIANGKICVKCNPRDNQIIIGEDRSFNFDRVFGIDTAQEPIYETCVKNLVLGCFYGLNATVLAYGQTGSGKTFTMGSGHTIGLDPEQLGIIPRVISFIFEEIEKRKSTADITIKCSFLEIYNEEIHDLLDNSSETGVDRYLNKGKDITIREEKNGNISVYGLTEEKVDSSEEMASCLDRGSNLRITSSTLMNNCSSRSHAIFTISIEQHIIDEISKEEDGEAKEEGGELEEFMTAKFHFVDLAGSERAKKTGATGSTLKEGISINKGLLSLGNVISALTDEKKKGAHVPYRDSKLTRILQDSLGGNSRTSMIACVSPAEFNFDESLNTLKYASRARNIKNKPIVNRDPNSALIAQLRQNVLELQKDLFGFKQLVIDNKIEIPESLSDAAKNLHEPINLGASNKGGQVQSSTGYFGDKETEEENKRLKQELAQSKRDVSKLQTEVKTIREQLDDLELEKLEIIRDKDLIHLKLEAFIKAYQKDGGDIHLLMGKVKDEAEGESDEDSEEMDFSDLGGVSILDEYRDKNSKLEKEVKEKDTKLKLLQNECESLLKMGKEDTDRLEEKSKEIQRLKRTNNKLQKENVTLKREQRNAGKAEVSYPAAPQPRRESRNTMYIPSTQKIGLKSRKRKNSKDMKNIENFELDENKIDEIESNIFTKITESVDKIFNLPNTDARSTFSGYQIFGGPTLGDAKDSEFRMTVNDKTNKDHTSVKPFGEIEEVPEEEEKESRKGTIRGNADRSTTFFFGKDSSDSASMDGDSDGNKEIDIQKEIRNKEREEELMSQITLLQQEVDEEEKEESKLNQTDENNETMDENTRDTHFDKEATEEDKQEDQKIKDRLELRETEVDNLDNALVQKQELLDAIVESNKEMKKEIVDTMKQEYLKKIIALQNEIKIMESQRERDVKKAKNETSKSTVNNEYKRKIKDMEKELKLFKKKDKEQVDKLRISKKQKSQISKLKEDINGMKSQKVSLMRQLKEDREQHRKWKNEKTKDLMKMKMANQKKDQQITKLKRENSKKANILRRKMEELKALQKRQKSDMTKHRKALNQKRRAKKINPEKIKEWVMDNTSKLMRYQDIKEELDKEEKSKVATEKEIEEEQSQFAEIQTKKEKLETKRRLADPDDRDTIEDIDSDLRGYELELNNINENLNSLEDKLDFVNEKISVFNKEVIEINPEGIERLRFEEITNLEEAKIYLGSFFNIFLEMNVYRTMVENKILEQDEIIEKQRSDIQDLQAKLQASEVKFREEISKMAQKYKEKQDQIKQEINEFMKEDLAFSSSQSIPGYDSTGKPPKLARDNSAKSTRQLRDEIKQRKQALREVARVQASSKIGLSKLVTSLERQTIEDEKKIEILNHKLKQALHEKQMFKQKYETLRNKVKADETDDIKMIKTISLDTIQKSHNSSSFVNTSNDYEGGLRSYRQVRKDRKKAPLNSARSHKKTLEELDRIKKNKTPSRNDKKAESSLGANFNYERRRVNSKSFVSSSIVTTPAPKPPKSSSNMDGLVKDESLKKKQL
ncbi:unnamed protein product [Moneuplotes crassus]|uniref:Kinesin motor domain-containing protein n=2 Tax=Euplotes crassus TaxID=5936 RepID=A0AAD1U043_EUPCR|nr:unnamed protein product [Moneuplotes crassus]